MQTDPDRRPRLRAVQRAARARRPFVFDVFTPDPTISPRRTGAGSSASRGSSSAPTGTSERRTLILRVRGEGPSAELSLAWLSIQEWRELLAEEGFAVEALYGWFDRADVARPRGFDLGLPQGS